MVPRLILECGVQDELLRGELQMWLKAGIQLDSSLQTGPQAMQLLLQAHLRLLFQLISPPALCWVYTQPVLHNPLLEMNTNHADALKALLLLSTGCIGLDPIKSPHKA